MNREEYLGAAEKVVKITDRPTESHGWCDRGMKRLSEWTLGDPTAMRGRLIERQAGWHRRGFSAFVPAVIVAGTKAFFMPAGMKIAKMAGGQKNEYKHSTQAVSRRSRNS